MFDTQNNAFRKLFEEGKYINLQIDYAKLTATENFQFILGACRFSSLSSWCSLLEPAYIFPLHWSIF